MSRARSAALACSSCEGLSGWRCECRLCGYGAILTGEQAPDGGDW